MCMRMFIPHNNLGFHIRWTGKGQSWDPGLISLVTKPETLATALHMGVHKDSSSLEQFGGTLGSLCFKLRSCGLYLGDRCKSFLVDWLFGFFGFLFFFFPVSGA